MRNIVVTPGAWTVVLDDEKIKILTFTFKDGTTTWIVYLHRDLL